LLVCALMPTPTTVIYTLSLHDALPILFHRAGNCGIQALVREGIGARHDDEGRIVPRIDRRLDAVGHFLAADELLAGTVAAALGAGLVLEMHRRGAGLDERARGARHVEGA